MSIIAAGEIQKREIEGRLARYRGALARWALKVYDHPPDHDEWGLTCQPESIVLRHGRIHFEEVRPKDPDSPFAPDAHGPLVFIRPSYSI